MSFELRNLQQLSKLAREELLVLISAPHYFLADLEHLFSFIKLILSEGLSHDLSTLGDVLLAESGQLDSILVVGLRKLVNLIEDLLHQALVLFDLNSLLSVVPQVSEAVGHTSNQLDDIS